MFIFSCRRRRRKKDEDCHIVGFFVYKIFSLKMCNQSYVQHAEKAIMKHTSFVQKEEKGECECEWRGKKTAKNILQSAAIHGYSHLHIWRHQTHKKALLYINWHGNKTPSLATYKNNKKSACCAKYKYFVYTYLCFLSMTMYYSKFF